MIAGDDREIPGNRGVLPGPTPFEEEPGGYLLEDAQFALYAEVQEAHWWFAGRREIVRAIVHRLVAPSRSTIVVDVGCGTGSNIAALADEYSCVGLEPSAEAVRFAQARSPSARFYWGASPDALGEIAGMARLFLLMDVLEHVADDFHLLSRYLAAASPGAEFLITVPADMSIWNEQDIRLGHYRRYDRRRLERLWEGLPVSVKLLSHYNARLYPIVRLIRAIGRATNRTWGDAGTDVNRRTGPMNRLLRRIFAGEQRILLELLEGRRSIGYSRGVSLIAVLRREPGIATPRARPADIEPDPFHPEESHER